MVGQGFLGSAVSSVRHDAPTEPYRQRFGRQQDIFYNERALRFGLAKFLLSTMNKQNERGKFLLVDVVAGDFPLPGCHAV